MDKLGEQMSLFDFCYDDTGNYIDLKEKKKQDEEKARLDKEQQKNLINEYLSSINNLAKIAYHEFHHYGEPENLEYVKKKIPRILATKCYHFGNVEHNLYVFSLTDNEEEKSILVFESLEHMLCYSVHSTVEEVLEDKEQFCFPACYCNVYDKYGNRIYLFTDSIYDDNSKEDIRQIVFMSDWKMNKYSHNRVKTGKPVKWFYEAQFKFWDMVKYWEK